MSTDSSTYPDLLADQDWLDEDEDDDDWENWEENLLKEREARAAVEASLEAAEEQAGTLEEQVTELKARATLLENKLNAATNNARNLRRTMRRNGFPKPSDSTSLEDYLSSCLDYGMRTHTQGRRSKVSAKAIAKMAWEYKDALAKPFLLKLAREWYRTNVFSKWNLARLMDLNGAAINLSSIDLIRSLKGSKFSSPDTIFPSSSTIQRVMTVVEQKWAKC